MDKEQIYKYIAKKIQEYTGITYPMENYYQLDSRIQSIQSFFKLQSREGIISKLEKGLNNTEKSYFVDIVTNNETYFFRDIHPFKEIEKISETWTEEKRFPIKIWSAGCSSGQEPYSVVMTLLNKKPDLTPNQLQIHATDISESILSKAKEGIYSELEVKRGLSEEDRNRFFKKVDNNKWQINKEVKNFVKYSSFNLKFDQPPYNHYDLVLCRNVLIYQTPEARKLISEMLYKSIGPNGYFMLGSSENLIGILDNLKQLEGARVALYKKTVIENTGAA